MKQTSKLGIIFTLILLTLCLAGCSVDPSNYTVASFNIVWTESKGEIRKEYIPTRVYYKIEGISTDQYIGCKYHGSGIGANVAPVLMKRKDFDHTLEFDTSSAKLILSKSGVNFSQEEWKSFGKNMMVQELLQLDPAVAEQVANAIIAADYIDYKASGVSFDGSTYICDADENFLRIQFSLKDYDNLCWIAYVLKYDGAYYIEIKEDLYITQYLLCSDEFASVLDRVCDENNLGS